MTDWTMTEDEWQAKRKEQTQPTCGRCGHELPRHDDTDGCIECQECPGYTSWDTP